MTLRKLTTPKPRKRSRQAGLSNPPPKVQRVERDELRRLKRREAQRRYQQSSRGRAAQRRYQHSAKGLMTQHRYRRSVKSLMCQIRYRHSSKGLARNWRFERTPARQRYKREWARRYRQTALCKERQLDRHYRRADALFRELASPGSYYPAYAQHLAQYYRLQDFLTKREQEQRAAERHNTQAWRQLRTNTTARTRLLGPRP